MKIAIASGKGGTGKTTLAVNLALLASNTYDVILCDLDVEEPNSSIFIQGRLLFQKRMYRAVPTWKEDRCNLCGKCLTWCNFNALLKLDNKIFVSKNLCHSCYACSEMCSSNALPMTREPMGTLTQYEKGNLIMIESRIDVGIEMAVPLISKTISFLEENYDDTEIQIWDCPPGTSCSVIEATSKADFVILVAEPTPFGLHDLSLTVNTMRYINKPLSVVINRYGIGDDCIFEYCKEKNIPIWATLPNKREIAELYSRGETVYDKSDDIRRGLTEIMGHISTMASEKFVTNQLVNNDQ